MVDVFTRQALATEAGLKLKGENVVEVLNRLVARHGAPRYVFVDNGSEFTGRLMDMWAYHHGVRLDFSRPGKPTDNSYVETFNGSNTPARSRGWSLPSGSETAAGLTQRRRRTVPASRAIGQSSYACSSDEPVEHSFYPAGSDFPRPVIACSSSMRFDASAFVSDSSKSTFASSLSVFR